MTPSWPRAHAAAAGCAVIKAVAEDFQVVELADDEPCGEGEHLWLRVRKTGLATPEVARWLAATFAVPESAVGYAGMKDKRAVTEQWFSVHTPRGADVLPARDDVEICAAGRHRRKLRRGELAGNAFRLRLTGVTGGAWSERLAAVREAGVPNYFGAQRFGRDNLEQARGWLDQRRRRRLPAFRRGLYLSVLRSFLFNEVLAARVAAGTWRECLPGEAAVTLPAPASRAVPSGPLWGRGRSAAQAQALDVEAAALAPYPEIREGLEHAGLGQERRALVLEPAELDWQASGNVVEIAFRLPPGTYATAVLGEVFDLREALGAAA